MIFISHNKKDEAKALKIKNYLDSKKIRSYIDVLDPSINSSTDITTHIISKLKESTHIIVVFTEYTKNSMWVPFELGAAYVSEKGIGVFLWTEYQLDLPEYLDAFPVMKNDQDLNQYIDIYNKTTLSKSLTEMFDHVKTASEKHYAQNFINELKSRI